MADEFCGDELYGRLREKLEEQAKERINKQMRKRVRRGSAEGASPDVMRADLTLRYFMKTLHLSSHLINILRNCSLRALLVSREGVVIGGTELMADQVFDATMEEIEGEYLSTLFKEIMDSDAFYKAVEITAAVLAGRSWNGSWDVAGIPVWEVRVLPLGTDAAGVVVLFNNLIPDKTEIREQERALRLMRMGEMASEVVHDLKNSLQNIYGYIQLLELQAGNRNADLNMDKVRAYCDMINAEISAAGKLSRSFMGMGNYEVDMQVRSLNDVVREAMMMTTGRCLISGIKVVDELAYCLPEIYLDRARSKQMIFNILDNALEAIEEKVEEESEYCGEIRITTELLPGKADESGKVAADKVLLKISDNGIGMTDEIRKKCMRPYFTTKKKGSGVGTTVMAAIVRLHGAALSIESEPGVGTVVTVAFPTDYVPQDEGFHLMY